MNSPRPPFVGKSVADFALFVGNANGKVVLLMLHFPLRLLRKLQNSQQTVTCKMSPIYNLVN